MKKIDVLGNSGNISGEVARQIENRATSEVMKNFNQLGEKERGILKKAICQ
jgi:hypothetical protein